MGLFDGCFVALVGPIAFDLCGPKSAAQAIGFLLGLYSVPMTTGPTVAGMEIMQLMDAMYYSKISIVVCINSNASDLSSMTREGNGLALNRFKTVRIRFQIGYG